MIKTKTPNRAAITKQKSRKGRSISICTECNKTAYFSESHAITGVRTILTQSWKLSRPYYNNSCGWWHITTKLNGY